MAKATFEPSAAQLLAIVKGLKVPKKKVLEPGEYSIRGLAQVRLDCVLAQAPPYDARAPFQLDAARLLAAASLFAGVKIEDLPGFIERAVRAAVLTRSPVELQQQHDVVTAIVKRVKGKLAQHTETESKKGALKVHGLVELEKLET